jgi:phosphatidylethanolamine/phosphatidyl-N-methylethanolamine N-methyltransferase
MKNNICMDNRQNKERRFWDKFANIYDSFINIVFNRTYKAILDNLNSDLNATNNVLDIGTGTGSIPLSIWSKVSSVIATDISPEMIRIANQKQKKSNIQNIDFQVQDSYKLTFQDKSFDTVIASNLLHLLYELDKPLNEVKRVLKDNGTFIAPTLCVGENKKSRIIAGITGALSGFKVVNKWSIEEFKNMLTNNGFTINKIVIADGRFPLAYIVAGKNSTNT